MDEKKQIMKIYKIAGIILGSLILIGIIYAIITSINFNKEQPKTEQVIETPVVEQINTTIEPVNQTIETNVTETNITETNKTNETVANQTVKINQTETNQTIQTNQTVNQTVINQTNTTKPIAYNYTWEGITIIPPETLKDIKTTTSTYHYYNITEIDGTPVANDEQFLITLYLLQNGRQTEQVLTYENKRWLFSLVLPNKGKYVMTMTVQCADKQGHCNRLYPEGKKENIFEFELV